MTDLESSRVCWTDHGSAHVGDSRKLMRLLSPASVDLGFTSPPFALQRPKIYGGPTQEEYVEWFLPFSGEMKRILKPSGSFVIDIRGAFEPGWPSKSLYPYELLIALVRDQGWHLAQEIAWFNPSTLPSPLEWCNKRKIRLKEATNMIFWLVLDPLGAKANVRNVLREYSSSMKRDIKSWREHRTYASGHEKRKDMCRDIGGAIPPNCLVIPTSVSNSRYLRRCRLSEVKPHPARMPRGVVEFFVRFLTEPGDLVFDSFAGSNTTGQVAEELGRRWLAFEQVREYLAASAFRFVDYDDSVKLKKLHSLLLAGPGGMKLELEQQKLDLSAGTTLAEGRELL